MSPSWARFLSPSVSDCLFLPLDILTEFSESLTDFSKFTWRWLSVFYACLSCMERSPRRNYFRSLSIVYFTYTSMLNFICSQLIFTCSKLTIKTPEWRGVFIDNFEHNFFLVFLLLIFEQVNVGWVPACLLKFKCLCNI